MNLNDLLPQIVNLTDAERNAGAPLRIPEAIRSASYRLVKARDEDRYYLTKDADLQPLLVRLGDIAEQARTSFSTWSLSGCAWRILWRARRDRRCACATAQAGRGRLKPAGCAPSSNRPAS